jgi:DNA mismatch endonuclease (patch repair protein)
MADIFTSRKRSEIMSRVRSTRNKTTEMRLIALFRMECLKGWRRGWPLSGKPDFVFPKEKTAIFVDGCFWHGCPKHASMPVNNRPFWEKKLSRNKLRDRLVTRALRARGWRVLRIWEHELHRANKKHCLRRIAAILRIS